MYLLCVLGWAGLLLWRRGRWLPSLRLSSLLLFPLTSSTLTLACLCLRLVVAAEVGRVECMYAISWSMLRLLCVMLTSSDGGWSAWGPSVGLFGCFLGLLGLRI